MVGLINSIETMGLVDGPGVRFVVFLQGCPLRCKFCHNPETWEMNKFNEEYDPKKLVDKIKRYKPYFGQDGGVTFSGGEPLMQPEFLKECLKLCKEEGINTCLDTSGVFIKDCKELLDYVDLVILDIKAYTDEDYFEMTGLHMDKFNEFLDICQNKNKRLWLRQVIIPTINDSYEYILGLKDYIKNIKNVEKVELLPYHTMAISKYEKLHIPYKLKNIKDMDKKKCMELQELLLK